MFEKINLRGKVTVRVLDERGNIKSTKPGFIRRMFNIPGKKRETVHHNIVTSQGDALLADWMSDSPTKIVINGTNGHIEVGTGWTGISPKNNTSCNTPTGTRQIMDGSYPQAKDAFGGTDDNVIVYRSTFTAGSLDASGIDEASLMNASAGGECLAYAQITPEVNVTVNDTLQIEWEITFLGS